MEIAKEPQDMMVGARFTYSADHFEAWCLGNQPESKNRDGVQIFQRTVLYKYTYIYIYIYYCLKKLAVIGLVK